MRRRVDGDSVMRDGVRVGVYWHGMYWVGGVMWKVKHLSLLKGRFSLAGRRPAEVLCIVQ